MNRAAPISEHKFWALTRFEWIMAILTLAGVLIAFLTGFIFWKQLHEMRTDQRAWITLNTGNVTFPKDASKVGQVQISTPLSITNIGKTAARDLFVEAVMDYEVNGQTPDFIYLGRARSTISTGIVFPNSPAGTLDVPFVSGKLHSQDEMETRYLTEAEYSDLVKSDAYMTVYAQASYLDIFGTRHWVHFCTYFLPPPTHAGSVTSRKCTEYNDTDSE